MGKRGALIACLVLAVLAGGGLAVLAVRDGGEEPSVGRPETNVGVETSTVPPRDESAGPIRFVLADRYVAGATVDVLIENVGTRAYVYQWPYQACFLRYFRRLGAAIHHPSRHALRPAQRGDDQARRAQEGVHLEPGRVREGRLGLRREPAPTAGHLHDQGTLQAEVLRDTRAGGVDVHDRRGLVS